jgi:hypothetical protein
MMTVANPYRMLQRSIGFELAIKKTRLYYILSHFRLNPVTENNINKNT